MVVNPMARTAPASAAMPKPGKCRFLIARRSAEPARKATEAKMKTA